MERMVSSQAQLPHMLSTPQAGQGPHVRASLARLHCSRGGRAVRRLLLTVFLSPPDADRVDSTTLLGKADLDFHQPGFSSHIP